MPNITEYISRTAQANENAAVAEILTGGNVTPERAHQLRSAIEVAAESFDDSIALDYPELVPQWQPGTYYTADQRVNYNGTLYKCLQAHASQPDWMPDVSPSLWSKVLIPDSDIIPEWQQPDSTNPYMTGDKVTHNGATWVSDVDNNVWEPGVYGWTEAE
ncbi:MAG: carbohydrate-binding protein [Gemmiger sp.]